MAIRPGARDCFYVGRAQPMGRAVGSLARFRHAMAANGTGRFAPRSGGSRRFACGCRGGGARDGEEIVYYDAVQGADSNMGAAFQNANPPR